MTRPRLLDLFCGAGGAAMGYYRAGFDVVGVDIDLKVLQRYPFEFQHGDAMRFPEWLDRWASIGWRFDAIHASPPCQAYTWGTRMGRAQRFPMLIEDLRLLLLQTGLPFVIENVPAAPLMNPVILCGSMFGLGVIRHRAFEFGSVPMPWPMPGHPRCSGSIARGEAVTVAGHGGDSKDFDWTRDRHELAEAIPPAYTEWVGAQLLRALESAA